MVKRKNKQTKQQRKSRRNRSNRNGRRKGPTPVNLAHLGHYVCAITNPFCPTAEGSKWPDQSSYKSLPVTLRGSVQVTTNSNGHAAVLFTAGWPNGYNVGAVDATATFATFAGAMLSYAGSPDFDINTARLVSGGLKFTSTSSLMTATGLVQGQELAGSSAPFDYSSVQLSSFMNTSQQRMALRDTKQMTCIFKQSGEDSRDFTQWVSTPVTALTTKDTSVLVISVIGGPASQVVGFIEYAMHYELRFKPGDAMNRVATAPPQASQTMLDFASTATSKLATFSTATPAQVDSQIMSTVKQIAAPLVGGGVTSGMAYAGSLIGGPIGAGIGGMAGMAGTATSNYLISNNAHHS